METKGFLKNEEELHKLNRELEERTRQWMNNLASAVNDVDEVESLMSDIDISHVNEIDRLAQSIFLEDASNGITLRRKEVKNKSRTKVKPKNKECDSFPKSFRGLSGESTIRFLRAKVSLLQNQLITVQHQLTTTVDNLKRTETDLKQSDDEKLRNSQELILLREKMRKSEQMINDLNEKNNLKHKEYNILKKENDMMKRDAKRAMATATAYELKLNRAKDDIERLKMNLKLSQNCEKEARDGGKAKNEELTQTVRKLEKQKSELISAFKKQLILIENVKKQKALVHVSKVLKKTDDEFLKLLDWASPEC